MGLRPTQGHEKRPGPAATLCGTVVLPFVIPSEAEGSAVLRTLPGNAFDRALDGPGSPPKLMKNASVRQLPSMNHCPFLVIPTGAKRRGGICGSTDPSWKCFFDGAKPRDLQFHFIPNKYLGWWGIPGLKRETPRYHRTRLDCLLCREFPGL